LADCFEFIFYYTQEPKAMSYVTFASLRCCTKFSREILPD